MCLGQHMHFQYQDIAKCSVRHPKREATFVVDSTLHYFGMVFIERIVVVMWRDEECLAC